MAETYYKLVGHKNPRNWTTEVVLAVNDAGEPTKVARVGEPVKLTGDDKKTLEGLGFVVESSSKSEADEAAEQAAQAPGGDVTGAAPVFGAPAETDQK